MKLLGLAALLLVGGCSPVGVAVWGAAQVAGTAAQQIKPDTIQPPSRCEVAISAGRKCED